MYCFGQRVLGLGEDRDQRGFVQLVQRRDDRQAADELRNEAELDQIFRLHVVEQVDAVRARFLRTHFRSEADAALLRAVEDDLLEARERAAAR